MECYLSRNYKETNSAGNKAKTDMEAIMRAMGLHDVGLPQSHYRDTIRHFLFTLASVLKSPFCLGRGDTLVLQYPLKKYYELVCDMAHARGAKVVTLIHDLGSFRRKALTVEREIRRLNHSDVVIVHNESMLRWLRDNECRSRLLTLGIFDYLSPAGILPPPMPESPYTVVYAGGLSQRKNAFLYQLGNVVQDYKVRLYGGGFDIHQAAHPECFEQMGFVPSNQLIATASGHFGLVWDGDSLDACSGDMGEYLRRFCLKHPHSRAIRRDAPSGGGTEPTALPRTFLPQGTRQGLCLPKAVRGNKRFSLLHFSTTRSASSYFCRRSCPTLRGAFRQFMPSCHGS